MTMRDKVMNQNDNSIESKAGIGFQDTARSEAIFADPVAYLATLGIIAEVVDVVGTSEALPVAA